MPLPILNYPCILDSLLAQSDDTTLASLLRVNNHLHHRAGQMLYHEITFRDELSPAIFSGAFFPTVCSTFDENRKNALLRYTRRAVIHLDGSESDGVRRGVSRQDQIALPALDVWIVIDATDRFLTPLDWGVKLGHSARHLVWKGIHGEALTNQLAGAKATARIMGARDVTLIMDGLPARGVSADIIDWEAANGSKLPCALERITVVAAMPSRGGGSRGGGRMEKYYTKQTVQGVYDLFRIILATVKCHALQVQVVGLEFGDDDDKLALEDQVTGGSGDESDTDSLDAVDMLCEDETDPDPETPADLPPPKGNWKVWDALLQQAKEQLDEQKFALLRLVTLPEWLGTREAKDVYSVRELGEMQRVAAPMQPVVVGQVDVDMED